MGSGPSSDLTGHVTLGELLTLPESLSCLIQKMRRLEQIILKGPASFQIVEKLLSLGNI